MFKFCSASAIVGWQGQTLHLRAGSVWEADDPFVRAHPEMFSDAPEVMETSSGVVHRGVEQATARPGEKRAR
jgi:hypothetical protein